MNNEWNQRLFKNRTGEIFGFLTVVKYLGKQTWECKCVCGAISSAKTKKLKEGRRTSCGCRGKHFGEKIGRKKRFRTSTYYSWQAMKHRCLQPKHERYKSYGGSGVTICERWKNSFSNFLEDLGERPEGTTLGRSLDLGNYEPGNAWWMSTEEQGINKALKRNLRTA